MVLVGIVLAAALLPSVLPAGESQISMRTVYPNPFTTSTTFQLSMPRAGVVTIAVFDIMGKRVRVLKDHEDITAGTYPVFWDGNDESGSPVIQGTYICTLFTQSAIITSVKVVKIAG